MQIIDQSHQLLPEQVDLIQQIGSRAAICYQTDGDKFEVNIKRVNHCLKNKHLSALEMGRVCKWIPETHLDPDDSLFYNKFVEHSFIPEEKLHFFSGSVRAWLEHGDDFENIVGRKKSVWLSDNHPDYKYHKYQAVKFITNRAMTHELVRHRPCSFLQESQRYVRYDKPGGVEFIKPLWYDDSTLHQRARWLQSVVNCEEQYIDLLTLGLKPQQARDVLPNSTKTEIIVYASLAEWKHIFYQRTQGGADPMMKALMRPVLCDFHQIYPGIFDELKPSVAGR